MVNVLLADDHAMVRAGLRMLLENMPQVRVVGEACDGREALALIDTAQPDVVLMDIGMPCMGGLEALTHTRRQHPRLRVIMLSIHNNEEYVLQALGAGAHGYLLKESGPEDLEAALKTVMAGQTYLSPAVSRERLDEYVARVGGEPTGGWLGDQLTPRQREILRLMAQGRTTQQIAQSLGISVKTVESHRSLMKKRLHIFDVPSLVRYAIRVGLVVD
jgi:DNA-binding NarL/FixJ family response regulator